jgi:hypothetical protein
MRGALATVAAALACGLAGCASLIPGPGATTASKVAQAQATHEYPSGPPPRERVLGGGSASAAAAVRAYADAYINWTAATITRDMLALATESVGQARSAAALAASQTAGDYELQRGGIANSGTVEAVAPLAGRPTAYVVVTREQTTATNTNAYQGLRPAWHVTLATVSEVAPGQWAVSGWQPES